MKDGKKEELEWDLLVLDSGDSVRVDYTGVSEKMKEEIREEMDSGAAQGIWFGANGATLTYRGHTLDVVNMNRVVGVKFCSLEL